LTALKCREPKIRWKAISLLKNSGYQEGMWSGSLIAGFAEQVARLEEDRAALA
jgi:hypothetical protein